MKYKTADLLLSVCKSAVLYSLRFIGFCLGGDGEICSYVDNVEVTKFVYLFMYQFRLFRISFFCVPKNPCCCFDSFFLTLFPDDYY